MNSELQRRETEEFLHAQIPITRAMGVRLEAADADKLVLTAPLDLNHNHLGTAFGGSLAAVATLAGYAFLWLELEDRVAHVVIAESTLTYRRPVRGDIRAVCLRPEEGALKAFKAAYAEKGKARLGLKVSIETEAGLAVAFTGLFVASRGL